MRRARVRVASSLLASSAAATRYHRRQHAKRKSRPRDGSMIEYRRYSAARHQSQQFDLKSIIIFKNASPVPALYLVPCPPPRYFFHLIFAISGFGLDVQNTHYSLWCGFSGWRGFYCVIVSNLCDRSRDDRAHVTHTARSTSHSATPPRRQREQMLRRRLYEILRATAQTQHANGHISGIYVRDTHVIFVHMFLRSTDRAFARSHHHHQHQHHCHHHQHYTLRNAVWGR